MTSDVVIGAASGIGASVARVLAGEDRRMVLADLDPERLEELAAELAGRGTDVEVLRCDITAAAEIDALAGSIGELGSLVLTAGLSPTMAAGRRIYEVDIVGPARLLAAIEPVAGTGSVAVVVASMAGHLMPPDPAPDAVLDDPLSESFLDDLAAAGVDIDEPAGAYGYSKRALMRLVRRSAARWGARGARVLSLSPGIVDTPMGRREFEEQPVMADMIAGSPLGRIIRPEEIASVIAFLVSDGASAMTGTDVLVDGGAVAALMG